jgi:ABC-type methionine transport system ATPase subunit
MKPTMTEDSQLTQKRIRLRIPKQYHQEPIISHLISHYQLTVNITAAILGANANGDGWFDLELRGNIDQIERAILYFNELHLEVWNDTDASGW